jgi:phenylacetate-CoA ligase
MPLIRYRLGDLAILDETPCPCGRGLPKVKEVVGRTVDVIVTPDGRHCCGVLFPHVMKEFPEVQEFQVYQPDVQTVIIRVVPSEAFTQETPDQIERALRQYLGETVNIQAETVPKLERTAGGKYRLTVSDILQSSESSETVS